MLRGFRERLTGSRKRRVALPSLRMRLLPSCVSPQPSPVIGERAQKAEGGAVVDERDVVLPGELDEGAAPVGEAFGEVLAGHVMELQDAAGFEVFHAQGGVAFEAGAFVEMAIEIDEALSEGLPIVRVGVDDAIGVGGGNVRGGKGEKGQRESHTEKALKG